MTNYGITWAELKAEDWPFCDICDEPMDDSPDGTPNDWNGETGNHLFCEATHVSGNECRCDEPGLTDEQRWGND